MTASSFLRGGHRASDKHPSPGHYEASRYAFLLIETKKLPALEGERKELVNEGMVRKALCQSLQLALPSVGINVPFFCNEDWGWWLQTERNGFRMGLCIYSDPDADPDPERYALMPSIQAPRQWSWSRFRWIDRSQEVRELDAGYVIGGLWLALCLLVLRRLRPEEASAERTMA